MPKIKYTLRLSGDEFSEEDYFVSGDPKDLVTKEVERLNEFHRKNHEPDFELVKLEVTNPHAHLHEWIFRKSDLFIGRNLYYCKRCKIVATKKINRDKIEIGPLIKDEPYRKNKYELCCDPLKKLPKLNI